MNKYNEFLNENGLNGIDLEDMWVDDEIDDDFSDKLHVKLKSYGKEDIFDVYKIDYSNTQENEGTLRNQFINIAFDFLGGTLNSRTIKDMSLSDFMKKKYEIGDFDWSGVFVKSCIRSAIDIISEIYNSTSNHLNIYNILNVDYGYIPKHKEYITNDIKYGDIVVHEGNYSDIKYLHYSIFLYKIDENRFACIDPNINEEGTFKKGEVHLKIRDSSDDNYLYTLDIFKHIVN